MNGPGMPSGSWRPPARDALAAPAPVKCLIVDDVEENLTALGALLLGDEVEVLKARSGPQALELLLEHDVALALLDVQMPGMDGFELAELMRGSVRTRHVPLIFLTAGSCDAHRHFKGYESGGVDFLYKPVDPKVLCNKAAVFFELYRQRQALARELDERTQTLRMNEMFIAVLSHDLRSPLMTVLGSSALLMRNPDADTVRQTGERLQATGQRMTRMVEDLLDVARARLAGGFAIQRAANDLARLMQRVVAEMEVHARRPIRITSHGDLLGEWDGARLSQAAVNLIGNALQHGDPAIPVDVRLDGSDAEMVELEVANGGVIPPDVLPRLFDPFYGAQHPADRSEGLGLGLYIVHQIVQAHGGHIDVHSVEDTRVVVRLPRC